MADKLYTREDVVALVRRAAKRLSGKALKTELPILKLFITFIKEELDGTGEAPGRSDSSVSHGSGQSSHHSG